MLEEGTNPKLYKQFYEYWMKQNKVAYQNLIGTDEFSKLIEQVLEAGTNYRKNFDSELTPPWWTVYKLSHYVIITMGRVFAMGLRARLHVLGGLAF